MTLTYINIQLCNSDDLALVRLKIIGMAEVRHTNIDALADLTSSHIYLNEVIAAQLQLRPMGGCKIRSATGELVDCKMAGPVTITLNGYSETRAAILLPNGTQPTIGTRYLNDNPVPLPYIKLHPPAVL